MNDEKDVIKENPDASALDRIKSGQVKMKPKLYFISRMALFVAGAILALLAVIFLISFIIFVLRGNGTWFLSDFGWPGIRIFLLAFPWILAVISLIFALVFESLLNRLGFAYRRPLIYSLLGVAVVVTVGGICVALTPLHRNAFNFALQDKLPMAGFLYRSYGAVAPIDNLYEGVVSDFIDENHFTVQTSDGRSFEVEMPLAGVGQIRKGRLNRNDAVMILGHEENLKIKGDNWRKFEKSEEPLFHFRCRGGAPSSQDGLTPPAAVKRGCPSDQ